MHKQTTNEAFAVLGMAVGYIETRCRSLIAGTGERLMGQILLVRHGQASFGAEDYDVLSETGWAQGRLLGAWLAERGTVPTALVRGDMRRHRETLEAMIEGAGWAPARATSRSTRAGTSSTTWG